MAYFDLDGKRFNLGGIASGKIQIDENGQIYSSRLLGIDSVIFIIKADSENSGKAMVLQGKKCQELTFDCFENSKAFCSFPFYNLALCDKEFPAKVSLCAFNPILVLNDTDSGIPAVFFEFEVENTSDEKLDFSICSICKNPFDKGKSLMGCSESGEANICLFGNDESICISTNEKNISFCENIASFSDFEKNFISGKTLENTPITSSSLGSAISTHFSIESGKKHKVSFVLSWFLPQSNSDGGNIRNYYTNYFESSAECCSYCFGHYDRLLYDSKSFNQLVFSSTLPTNVLTEVNNSFLEFSKKDFQRISCGAPITHEYEKFSDMNSFINRAGIVCTLFPALEYAEINYLYKNCLSDDGEVSFCGQKNLERQLILILRSYRKYILTGNADELIEDWYYIVKCFEYFCAEDNASRLDKNADGRISMPFLQQVYSACLYAMSEMALAVKDKKRFEKYSCMYENVPMQEAIDFSVGFSKLCQYSGFSYNAITKHISFSPLSNECPLDFGGTFRAPFFTPDAYGYVEEGIDYIEINVLKGSLGIRSFGVPRVPRMVQYGGRNWKFRNKDNVAILDSELEVTQSKKLTILIDIK